MHCLLASLVVSPVVARRHLIHPRSLGLEALEDVMGTPDFLYAMGQEVIDELFGGDGSCILVARSLHHLSVFCLRATLLVQGSPPLDGTWYHPLRGNSRAGIPGNDRSRW